MAKQLKQFPMGEKERMKMKMKMKMEEEEEEENPNFDILHHDVIIDAVLPRLPVKSLLRFSSVCKLWFNSINNDSNFISSHFLQSQKKPTLIFVFKISPSVLGKSTTLDKNSIIHMVFSLDHNKDDDHIINGDLINHNLGKLATIETSSFRDLIGFCNGLICFRKGSTLEVCNPSRREVLSITYPQDNSICSFYIIGFGFDTLTNEYKVVSICRDLKCIIFTLGGSSWREIPGPNIVPHPEKVPPTLCNGVLYWRILLLPPKILSFDLHSEEFQVISIPFDHNNYYNLVEYKGFLCLARLVRSEECKHNCVAQLKILKDKTNQVWVEENICVPFRYPLYFYDTICFMSFSDQVLLCWFTSYKVGFRLFNLHSENLIEVKYPGCGLDYHLTSHVENFLSLRTLMQHSGSFCRIMSLNAYFDDRDRIFKV